MAQNVTIAGASYSDVPSIVVPKTGGGTASFTDVSPTTAVASDVASGKVFFLADGTQGVGTSSGGGIDWDGLAKKTWPTGEAVFTGTSITLSFNGFTGITKVTGLSLTSIQNSGFANCTGLTSVDIPLIQTLGAFAFQKAKIAGALVLANLTSFGGNSVFENNALTAVDIGPNLTNNISNYCFSGNTGLNVLVLRKTGSIVGLGGTAAFNNTPFASGKAGGTLYVPSALISSYQAATNWSTILGYANNQIKSIESTHTDPNAPIDLTLYYADGTPIT